MLGTLKGRILVILAVLALSGWYIYSNGLTLGLDLQGGMYLALEVENPEGTLTQEAEEDAIERALKVIRTRINQFGVQEPLIQKVGADRIVVQLAGIRDEERAKNIIQQSAYLEFQLVRSGREFREALPLIDRAIVQALGPEAFADQADGVGEREDVRELLFGGGDTTATDTTATDTTTAQTAVAADSIAADTAEAAPPRARPLTSLLRRGRFGGGSFLVAEENVERVKRYLALPEVQTVLPRGIELRWAAHPRGEGATLYRALYVLDAEAIMTGEYLEEATAGRSQRTNETLVRFELNRRGGAIFERFTARHVGDELAVVLDGEVYSAATIQSRIGSSGQITLGGAPLEEARDLALVLRAGALPVPLKIVEERTVGPSLGQESVEQGKIAGVVAIILVVGLMIGYYRFAGVLAVLGLAVYALMILGGLAAFGATLTLPGIAGLILSIGMGVDANVLQFERIREELDARRTLRTAVDEGFENAFSAIFDGNLTVLIVALVLFQFGTGPVRGFAVTLAIGIIASFFSAVYVTRTFFMIYMRRKGAAESISI